jgi:hypothetical protein
MAASQPAFARPVAVNLLPMFGFALSALRPVE